MNKNTDNWAWKRTQSILPLVFDDSMSYYETISRLIYTVNAIVAAINGGIDESLNEYISANFNNVMINATYDPLTETIILSKEEK